MKIDGNADMRERGSQLRNALCTWVSLNVPLIVMILCLGSTYAHSSIVITDITNNDKLGEYTSGYQYPAKDLRIGARVVWQRI